MAVNPYFNNFAFANTQGLMDDLVVESIKIHGFDVQYLPRTLIDEDELYGEDTLSKFTSAFEIEMYINDFEGFEGGGDIFSKFGFEIRDEITFTVSKTRFANVVTITTESVGRPAEGDFIYFPMNDKMYEVNHVEHEKPFYTHGVNYTYELKCDLVTYTSERVETGNTEIDSIDTLLNLDISNTAMFSIEGEAITDTSNTLIVTSEDARVENRSDFANNEFFDTEAADIMEFDERNPFQLSDKF